MNEIIKRHQQYAMDVIDGKIIACHYIQMACKRYLSFFDKYEYREGAVEKVINFIQKLRHFKGKHNGKPFILMPWQVWIISAIFGFYRDNGKRLINNVYIEIARKNGKTAFIGAISLYMLIADGESGAEIDFLANNAKQAAIAYEFASYFLQSIDPKGKYFERLRSKIKFDKTKSFIQVLSSESSGLDGFDSSCFVLDEVHEQKDSRLYDVMISSQGQRENPLALLITTAGFNMYGFCYPYRKICTEVISGHKEDDSMFAAIFTLDEEDKWDDENVWVKSNPNLGITVQRDYLERQINNAKLNSALEVGTKTKNLNMWVSSSDVWINNDLLLQSTKKFELTDFENESICFLGVDLASVSDLTALSVMIPYEGKFYFKNYFYLPESCLENNPNSRLYFDWMKQGYLTITSGNVTDYDYVTKDILKVADHLLIDKIAYDQYNSVQWAIDCTEQNLPIEPYSQALWSFNRPTKEFERLLKMGKVVIDDNPIIRWNFANVTLKFDFNENCKPTKGDGKNNKIDGVIGMLQALGIYLLQPQYSNEIITLS
ncbi:MAG: terminase large subunit [Muribaculaceae bacterium]|nr:terminase large subunit [Muribaculaceae bacterium]